MTAWHGVHLGGLEIQVGRATSPDETSTLVRRTVQVPPAIVFSLATPPRLSERGPLPLAGAGLAWPASARADLRAAACPGRRVPLAMVWESFIAGSGRLTAGEDGLEAEDALALATESVLPQKADDIEALRSVCLVVPNELSEGLQQALIDAFKRRGLQATLLWRPVAAALAWLELHATEFAVVVDKETSIGSLLTVHLGVDGFEAAWLELILRPETGMWLLPARRRPVATCLRPAAGRELLEEAGRRACVVADGESAEAGIWRALWASPASMQLSGGEGLRADLELWGVDPEFTQELRRGLVESRRGLRSVDHQEWLQSVLAESVDHDQPLGAIVTGEFASISLDRESVVRESLPARMPNVEIEGSETLASGVLCRSAASYVSRLAKDMPTYLDTLPRMEVLLEEKALPIWKPLLKKDQKYVSGGQRWRREPDLSGLGVPAHSPELNLSVWVEPEESVRKVSFPIADPPERKVAVKLRAEMEPAGGHARVQLLPEEEGALGRRALILDWNRAQDTGLSREDVIEGYPLKCPATHPRSAWDGGWVTIERVIRRLRTAGGGSIREGINSAPYMLKELRTALNASQPNANVGGLNVGAAGIGIRRAVDSDGRLHERHATHQGNLDELIGLVAESQALALRRDEQLNGDAVAALGYACAKGEPVQEIVQDVLRRCQHGISREEAMLLAGCIDNAESASHFLSTLLHQMSSSWTGFNEVLKCAGFLVQWREWAVSAFPSDAAVNLTFQAQQMIAAAADIRLVIGPRPTGLRRGFLFFEKNSLVLIAYLLRKRIGDDAYLAPDSSEAEDLKSVLVVAEHKVKSGELGTSGGSVRTDVLLRRVIEYIDRRGTGTVVAD